MAGRGKKLFIGGLFLVSACILGRTLGSSSTSKGTQPGLTYPLQAPADCLGCHGYYDAAHIEPYNTWAGSMMAQAARDPLFWAALDVANNDEPGIGDFCLRCHVPQGWLQGRSEPPGGSTDGCGLVGQLDQNNRGAEYNDFEGVTCHLCHRMMVNPSPPSGQAGVYFENAQYWIDDTDCGGMGQPCRRGPYDYLAPGESPPPHAWAYSAYHESSDLCGNCHNVTNPVKNLIQNGTDMGIRFPIERTFKEWQQSSYAEAGPGNATCQDCHMRQAAEDPAYPCLFQSNDRTGDMPIHEFAGGNAWIPDVIRQQYPNLGLDDELQEARDAALDMLQNQSASVEVTVPAQAYAGQPLAVQVKVTNLTGHKLPTGYPEGRRMWLDVQATDGEDQLFWESGAYNPATGVLTADPSLKVYQVKQGIWNANGNNTCDVVDGVGSPIFHFVKNNCIAQDNRIPPLGFTGGTDIETKPVNHFYPETAPGSGELVNYDITGYSVPIPPGVTPPVTITATLRYQTSSKEYIDFLRDEAVENSFPDDCIERTTGPTGQSRGEFMHTLWSSFGKSPPVDMAADAGQTAIVVATPGEASGPGEQRMRVTAFNKLTGLVTIAYDPACAATDHTIYAGSLSAVGSVTFTQQACARGTSGTTTFTPGPGSVFWVIVGNDGVDEGSYGKNSAAAERPENTSLPTCNLPQDLSSSCDP